MAEELPYPADILPHRGYALAIDELTELEPGRHARGLWTPDEDYYRGHNVGPNGEPILPGHWTMESVGLVGACAILATGNFIPNWRESSNLFTGQVSPGDQLDMTADFGGELTEMAIGGRTLYIAEGKGLAKVGKKVVYRAPKMKAILMPKPEE